MDLKKRATQLKTDIPAVFLSLKSKDTPLLAKVLAGITIAYALSPIDLIPDFIPVLGQLDDLLIVPLGIVLAVRLIPPPLMAVFRTEAEARATRPRSLIAAAVIALIWLLALIGLGALALRRAG